MLALVAVSLGLASFASAAPTVRAPVITDTAVLQYALTLEHLEDSFYHEALAKFDEKAFENAGFPSWVRGRYSQIAEHEASHVASFTSILGKDAVPACEYSFPYTDPKSFVALSMAIEGTGTSAFLGAAQFLSSKSLLTAAGSILATEARHDAWVSSAVLHGTPWNLAFDTPLGFSGAFSIASQFITKCPENYPALPVTPFPALKLSASNPEVGGQIAVTFNNTANVSPIFLAYYSGLNTFFEEIKNGMATIPNNLTNAGAMYAAVVSNNTGTPSDSSTLSGLAVLDFPFASGATQLS